MQWGVLISLLIVQQFQDIGAYRLPTSLWPTHYNLDIITYLEEPTENAFHFTGRVQILVKCVEETKNVTLHSNQLSIDHKKTAVKDLTVNKPVLIPIDDQTSESETDFFIINLGKKLEEDHVYEVTIEFSGKLIDGLYGYYKSSYMDTKTKKQHWLATTHFEPDSARKAFPCFDEPSFKAKFTISLGHHANLTAISNMPLSKTEDMEDKAGWVWDRFEESVPMSTYLIAYVVSDFKHKVAPKIQNSEVTFNIWARPEALSQVEYATEVGPRSFKFIENYFGIEYPLPKQDMIAIPDFSAGAMENWGLITYREVYLLYDNKSSSVKSKYKVASVVAHELAHQWFGNLVTMKWWTDLWLNEGFATYISSITLHNLYPQWHSLQEEVVENLLLVFMLDSLQSSHPISVPITTPSQIPEIFDVISYKKGSLLIRMMSLFLGENVVRQGVSNYLKLHSYKNAEQDDLWEALSQRAHESMVLSKSMSVKQVMDTWTLQTGHPVVTVTRNYETGKAELAQEIFVRLNNKNRNEKDSCWWIPISYTNKKESEFNSTVPKAWMACPKAKEVIDTPNSDQWIIVNIQASGIYKVNYDKKNWNMIINTLKSKDYKRIPTLNRVLLIDNALDLAETGYLHYDVSFPLLSYIRHEEQYLPWKTALDKIEYLSKMLKNTHVYGTFKKYVKKLLYPIYNKLGRLKMSKQNGEKLDTVNFQVLIASSACKYGISSCKKDAVDMFQQWKNHSADPDLIPQDIKPVVFCNAISQGGEEEWNFLWQQYLKSNVGAEKTIILDSLGCSRESWLLNRYLDWSIDGVSGIRQQDAITVFNSVTKSDIGYFIGKSFLMNRIEAIYKSFHTSEHRVGSYISNIAKNVVSKYEYDEFTRFMKDQVQFLSKAKQSVKQALEAMSINLQWQKMYYLDVEKILMNMHQ